jgi:2',3'-cyclic-nucleotide 2'-phosphodiesterase (5'-nucleotidase family)
MPAVIEGSSHDFLTDAFRAMGIADIGAIRGFRYGAHVAPGDITREHLYNYIPIGPLIATGTVSGTAVRKQIEDAADGALNPDVSKWTGGWLFNYSGLTMHMNPYGCGPSQCPPGGRASAIMVFDRALNTWVDFDDRKSYAYASYYYPKSTNPLVINGITSSTVPIPVKDQNGIALVDGAEVVVRYLQEPPLGGTLTELLPPLPRNQLAAPDPSLCQLPPPSFGNPEIQPLRGVPVVPGGPVLCP